MMIEVLDEIYNYMINNKLFIIICIKYVIFFLNLYVCGLFYFVNLNRDKNEVVF